MLHFEKLLFCSRGNLWEMRIFIFFSFKIGYSEQLNKSWNKSSSLVAILAFFAYADRALLATFRKSVLLSLMTLFLGIFLTGFCILHIFIPDFKQNILEEKRLWFFCFSFFFFNWDLFHAKLNSHYEAWSYMKKKTKKKTKRLKLTGNLFRKNLNLKHVC